MKRSHVGVVVAVDGSHATIRFERGEMCAHCGACHTSGNNSMEIVARNELGAVIGDHVEMGLADGKVAKASLWAYALPLALLVLGIILGCSVSELVGLVCGMIACGAAFGILFFMNRRWTAKKTYEPYITYILTEEDVSNDSDAE